MTGKPHILIVDDQDDVCELIRQYLSEEGYRVSVAHNGAEMRGIIEQADIDLVLLDVMLPDEDGLSLARFLRGRDPGIGIIMLTGRGDAVDRIIGLEMGADDYLPKPFHMRELLARVRSVVRRTTQPPSGSTPQAADGTQLGFAGWVLDRTRRELISPGGNMVLLTNGELDLLVAFVTHPKQLLSRDRLLDLVRGRETSGPFDRAIDVQVARLRRKLQDNPQQPAMIKTLRGGGYMFTAPVAPAASQPRNSGVPRRA